MRCTAVTRKGEPCKNTAVEGTDRCRTHRKVVDETAVARLDQLLRAGSYPEVAALASGVSLDDLPHKLRVPLESARAETEVANVLLVTRAARDGNWQAAAWLLERQYPERWGRPAVRHTEEPVAPVADGLDELASKRAARRAAVRR